MMMSPTTTPPADHESTGSKPRVACLSLDARRAARLFLFLCLFFEVGFLVLDYHVNYGRGTDIGALRRMFNTAREDGLASWFAVTQTLFVALTLWLIYALAKAGAKPRRKTMGWLVLALFFTYMAVDDGAQIHERLGSTFERLFQNSEGLLHSFPSYAWQVVFLPMFAALGAFTSVFLWLELGTNDARAILIGAMGLLGMAVVLDFIEGLDADHAWNVYTWSAHHFDLETWASARFGHSAFATLRHFSKSVEETMEMAGHSLLWFLLLRHLPVVSQEFRVRFRPGGVR